MVMSWFLSCHKCTYCRSRFGQKHLLNVNININVADTELNDDICSNEAGQEELWRKVSGGVRLFTIRSEQHSDCFTQKADKLLNMNHLMTEFTHLGFSGVLQSSGLHSQLPLPPSFLHYTVT